MGDLSEHFSRGEFACQGEDCCSRTSVVDERLVAALEDLRALVGQPIVPHSAFRCLTHNRRERSEDRSQHVWGRAVDIHTLDGMTVAEMAAAAERVPAFGDGGMGLYDWGVHLDVRRGRYPTRWDRRGGGL